MFGTIDKGDWKKESLKLNDKSDMHKERKQLELNDEGDLHKEKNKNTIAWWRWFAKRKGMELVD
jgi:hypothetical protein